MIGADRLIYQDLADLKRAVGLGNEAIQEYEDSVFTGRYITPDVSPEYLQALETSRSDQNKEERRRKDNAVLEIHNDS